MQGLATFVPRGFKVRLHACMSYHSNELGVFVKNVGCLLLVVVAVERGG